MKNLSEFGERVVTLNTGAQGLRGGLRCEVKAVEGDSRSIDFIASDESLDRYNEVVSIDGWQLDNFRKNPVIPDCHDYSSIAKILGRAQSIGVQDKKLVNRVEFCMDNPMGSMAYKMAKGGFIKSQSVGFIPLEWENGKGKDEPARRYVKQELLEVSLVVVPANPGATIGLALKSGAIERKDLKGVLDLMMAFRDPFDKFRQELGVDKVDDFLALFGLGPKYQPAPKKLFKCPNCGGEKAYWKEFGADCDAGQNYMALYCPDCGFTDENFCGDEAAPGGQAGASAAGSFDAQLLQLAKVLGLTG